MRASHKKRLARLVAALDEAEEEMVGRRTVLRFKDSVCEIIRDAMERRGIDPASSRVLLDLETEVASFIDTPDLEAADNAWLDAHPHREWLDGEDPWDSLAEQIDPIALRYLDGSLPDFRFASWWRLWAWAVVQYRLLPAIPDKGYGVSVKTS